MRSPVSFDSFMSMQLGENPGYPHFMHSYPEPPGGLHLFRNSSMKRARERNLIVIAHHMRKLGWGARTLRGYIVKSLILQIALRFHRDRVRATGHSDVHYLPRVKAPSYLEQMNNGGWRVSVLSDLVAKELRSELIKHPFSVIGRKPLFFPRLKRGVNLRFGPARVAFLMLNPCQVDHCNPPIGKLIEGVVAVEPTGDELRGDLIEGMPWSDLQLKFCLPSQQISSVHRVPDWLPRLKPFHGISPGIATN